MQEFLDAQNEVLRKEFLSLENRLRLRVPPRLSQPEIQSRFHAGGDRQTAPRTGAKPTAPPRPKLPPPILRKGANFSKYPDCTRLRINYSKAVRTADDGIKIHCPDVETFRSLNKYPWTSKSTISHVRPEESETSRYPRHSYRLPGRRNPSRLCGQGFCALGAQTLPQRRLTIMAILRRPSQDREAKNIFNNLNMVCASGYPRRPRTRKEVQGSATAASCTATRPPTVMRTRAA
ncbi:hypothetical protein EVAR_84746_1 [Eumeta japonica]|uniref:Uncharacterized protein n=1 Tax=Eumeta variegata TaxID=151549 RepID=A0A4C1VSQ8_EUMVA|nr:hypothetical protein EVAR_84746_1 [Eumeta japonica]